MTGVYCVFCRTGFEAGIESRLKRRGYATLVPKIKKFKPSGGKLVEKELCLLPGYVFFETDEKELDVRSINTLQSCCSMTTANIACVVPIWTLLSGYGGTLAR